MRLHGCCCRTENGLPENRIIYACSNQLYKYDPETFNSWSALLDKLMLHTSESSWMQQQALHVYSRLFMYTACCKIEEY